jgi:serine/threonine protein phosphatase PrpC
MNYNLIYTKDGLSNHESGDIAYYIENGNNKIWYVIDAVSSCENPRRAAVYAHQVIQEYCADQEMKNRFDLGALLMKLHSQLSEQIMNLTVCFSAVIQLSDGSLEAINVGDCRVYEFRNNLLMRVTRDDSYIQDLIDKGDISEIEATVHQDRSSVSQTLGNGKELKMNFYQLDRKIDGFILTSDGIHGELLDHQIAHVLFNENLNTEEAYHTILKRSKVLEGNQDDQSLMIVKKEILN